MKPCYLTVHALLRLLALTACLLGASAHADDEYTSITRLLEQGQAQEALEQLAPRITANPRDPQLRFLRGMAQAKAGQHALAVDSFEQLIQLYPELPEPYNNLAVLYAAQNQLDKARAALEQAVRVHPGYAIAQENLGDIHVRLAIQAYTLAQAQQLDTAVVSGPSLAPKLELLRKLLSASSLPVAEADTSRSDASR